MRQIVCSGFDGSNIATCQAASRTLDAICTDLARVQIVDRVSGLSALAAQKDGQRGCCWSLGRQFVDDGPQPLVLRLEFLYVREQDEVTFVILY